MPGILISSLSAPALLPRARNGFLVTEGSPKLRGFVVALGFPVAREMGKWDISLGQHFGKVTAGLLANIPCTRG